MATKTIGIREDVYERLKAHKRGGESFSETLDRILHDIDTDWRTNVGFLSEAEADVFEKTVTTGLREFDEASLAMGEDIAEQLSEDHS